MSFKSITLYVFIIFSVSTPTISLADASQKDFEHNISWKSLSELNGNYLQDKYTSSILLPSLKKLLGNRYKEFMESIATQPPIEIENGVLIVSGMFPHSGGDWASIAYFDSDNKLLAVLKKDKKLEYFGSEKLLMNPTIKDSLNEFNNPITVDEMMKLVEDIKKEESEKKEGK